MKGLSPVASSLALCSGPWQHPPLEAVCAFSFLHHILHGTSGLSDCSFGISFSPPCQALPQLPSDFPLSPLEDSFTTLPRTPRAQHSHSSHHRALLTEGFAVPACPSGPRGSSIWALSTSFLEHWADPAAAPGSWRPGHTQTQLPTPFSLTCAPMKTSTYPSISCRVLFSPGWLLGLSPLAPIPQSNLILQMSATGAIHSHQARLPGLPAGPAPSFLQHP